MLATQGNHLRMPHSRCLGDGLFVNRIAQATGNRIRLIPEPA